MPTLPFISTGRIEAIGGADVAINVPITIWPATSFTTPAGQQYDHQGECPLEYFDELTPPNRQIVLDGSSYRVVQALRHEYLPHVSLLLRRMTAGGA